MAHKNKYFVKYFDRKKKISYSFVDLEGLEKGLCNSTNAYPWRGSMKKSAVFFLSLLFSLILSTASFAYDQQEANAIRAAESFLGIVDQANYGGSWEASASYLKARHPKEYYIAFVGTTRAAFGGLINRSIISAKLYDKFFGYPDGKICVVRYETSFENKSVGREIVTLILNSEGQWEIAEYTVG